MFVRVRTLLVVLIALFVLLESHLLNYRYWSSFFSLEFLRILPVVFLFFYMLKRLSFLKKKDVEKKYVFALSFFPLITIVLKLFYDGSSGITISSCMSLSFLVYFVFSYYDIDEKTILRFFSVIAIITALIQIFQQFFPEQAYFHSGVGHGVRNGLHRFFVGNNKIQIFCMLLFWTKLIKKVTIPDIFGFLLCFASMYLYLTRQIMVASIATMAISFLFVDNKKAKIYGFCITLAIGVVLFVYSEVLFKNFIDMTSENTYSSDIRMEGVSFFLKQTMDNPVQFVFGHGYTRKEELWMSNGFYASDIGFVGEMFHYGIVWIVLYFLMLYKHLFVFRKKIPHYITLYFIATGLISIMIFPYRNAVDAVLWSSILYISSLYINKKREGKV